MTDKVKYKLHHNNFCPQKNWTDSPCGKYHSCFVCCILPHMERYILLVLSLFVLHTALAASGEEYCMPVDDDKQSSFCPSVSRVCWPNQTPPDLRLYTERAYNLTKQYAYEECRKESLQYYSDDALRQLYCFYNFEGCIDDCKDYLQRRTCNYTVVSIIIL